MDAKRAQNSLYAERKRQKDRERMARNRLEKALKRPQRRISSARSLAPVDAPGAATHALDSTQTQ